MGLGSQLLDFIKENYQQYPNLIVGTADCGLAQIRFYERNGFVKYAIRKDFSSKIMSCLFMKMVNC
jgi:aminoglycoside 6'-N-acetyltransferase I